MSTCGFVSEDIEDIIEEGDNIILEQAEAKQELLVKKEAPLRKKASPGAIARPQAVLPLVGKVLAVNKKYDFAVIDVGRRDGIRAGDIFLLYHNDNYIGDIQIDRTREIISACIFVSKEVEDKITVGDKVIRK